MGSWKKSAGIGDPNSLVQTMHNEDKVYTWKEDLKDAGETSIYEENGSEKLYTIVKIDSQRYKTEEYIPPAIETP